MLLATIPFGQFARRRADLHAFRESRTGQDPSPGPGAGAGPSALTWSERRLYKVPDSAAAGGLFGSALYLVGGTRSLRHVCCDLTRVLCVAGNPAILRGALLWGGACSLAQLAVNEAGLLRIRFISLLARDVAQSPLDRAEPAPSVFERLKQSFGAGDRDPRERRAERLERQQEIVNLRLEQVRKEIAQEEAKHKEEHGPNK